ncbi:MAG: hypothetical protein DHS20C01_27960 [marine bacterium B5-7]|nr:MAG: hypothetical protein DHS20C01_27960 [marine bacterium B5-7]
MAAWLPIIKVVLPYLAPTLQAALPAFTKKESEKADPLVARQITELQEAVNHNSESTKALAMAIEEVAQANDKAMKRLRMVTAIALAVATVSFLLTIMALLK